MPATFLDELQHAVVRLPVTDALPLPPEGAPAEAWEAFRLSRTPKMVESRDNVGEEVRVLSLEEAVPELTQLMREKGVFGTEVWEEIWEHRAAMRAARLSVGREPAPHHVLTPATEEEQVRVHLQAKCPNPEHRAIWAVYRDGKMAHARALERMPWDHSEVWVQWIVGTLAVGKPSLRVAQVLYDVGVRRICWKALPGNTALAAHWDKYPQFKRVTPGNPDQQGFKPYHGGLLHGTYQEYCFEMTKRPERWEDYLR